MQNQQTVLMAAGCLVGTSGPLIREVFFFSATKLKKPADRQSCMKAAGRRQQCLNMKYEEKYNKNYTCNSTVIIFRLCEVWWLNRVITADQDGDLTGVHTDQSQHSISIIIIFCQLNSKDYLVVHVHPMITLSVTKIHLGLHEIFWWQNHDLSTIISKGKGW